MERIIINCKCKHKIKTDSFYKITCSHCGRVYVQIKNNGDDSYTWEIEE